jgi:Papain family cysteine protease
MRDFLVGTTALVVGVWAAGLAHAQERTVFAYTDKESRKGCFIHLSGPDWIELTGSGDRFNFKEVDRVPGRIEIVDKTRDGVGVRLFADKSEWKSSQGTSGKWERLWSGAWTTAMDLRPEFKKWGLTPTGQGDRGTCSVFVTNSALEFAYSRYLGKEVKLSVEYLNWAANQVTGHPSDGQFFQDALAGFDKFGVCHEADMPYKAKFDPKLAPSREARADAKQLREVATKEIRTTWIRPLMKKQGLTEAHMHEIKGVLAKGWPVAIGSDHSRLIVGFKDDAKKKGGGVFTVKDSATARYEEVTYEFVKTKVDDVYWIEAVGVASTEQK